MKKFLLGMAAGFVLAGLTGVIVVFATARIAEQPKSVPSEAVLELKLSGSIDERSPVHLPWFSQPRELAVYEVWALLREAARDSRVKALVLEPSGVSAGWATLSEIRAGLEKFRESGKPFYAYLRSPRSREYYLATAAERILMAPEDALDLKGLRIEATYLGNTMSKLGIQMEIEHAGRYKDAGDILTRSTMREETREVLNQILDGTYGHLIDTIAQGRKLEPAEVRAVLDEGPFLPQQAVDKRLVDELVYRDQLEAEIKKKLGVEKYQRVDGVRYAGATAGKAFSRDAEVALVLAQGGIVRQATETPFDTDYSISANGFSRVLRSVRENDKIKAAVVRIDSPGGDAFASDEILREMKLLSKKKPVVISMSDVAASGGYYIAMTGDAVVAYPNTLTGSIGVVYGKANLRGLYDKIGVTKEILTRGRFAAIDSDYRPLSEAEREKLRESIQAIYTTFVDLVAEARKRPEQEIRPLAEGRVWLGSQAKERGLLDHLGGLDAAIALARERAGLKPDPEMKLAVYPRQQGWLEILLGGADRTVRALRFFELLEDPLSRVEWHGGRMLRLMPYRIEIQ